MRKQTKLTCWRVDFFTGSAGGVAEPGLTSSVAF